jgi:hypothetical protein
MSRTLIVAVVASIIAALTLVTYLGVSSTINDRVRKDSQLGVSRARELLARTSKLEALSIFSKAERLSADEGLLKALKSDAGGERASQSNFAFGRFKSKESGSAADIIALLDATGNVIAMSDVPNVVAKQWKDAKGEIIWPGIKQALTKRVIISEIWDYPEQGMMKVGIAPVIDPDATGAAVGDGRDPSIVGAVVIAYSQTSRDAQSQSQLMGVQLAYVDNGRAFATSFQKNGKEEDTAKQAEIASILKQSGAKLFAAADEPVAVSVNGSPYVALGLPMRRESSKALPTDYPAATAAALVLAPISNAGSLAAAKNYLLILGIGAIGLALLGMYLVHRRLIAQIDPIEVGVADIINGNIDRTFRPVGSEFDGLANGLNVMMARLLGRPEPGDEEYDEEGNPIVPGRVEFEEADAARGPDAELAALAQESEPDYYKRIYTEYLSARKAVNQPDQVSFENFIAKLKVNEGKLKAQHQCKAVRFRVITKDSTVSLKPVPIFA